MESSSEEVGLRLPDFLLTLPDMPLVWPLTRLALCVLFEFIVADVLSYTLPLRLSWQPDWRQISVVELRKIVFPQLLPIFYWFAIFLSRYYRFLHYMRLRQFTSFIHYWSHGIKLPSHPFPAAPSPLPLLLACERALCLGKGWKNREERERVRA